MHVLCFLFSTLNLCCVIVLCFCCTLFDAGMLLILSIDQNVATLSLQFSCVLAFIWIKYGSRCDVVVVLWHSWITAGKYVVFFNLSRSVNSSKWNVHKLSPFLIICICCMYVVGKIQLLNVICTLCGNSLSQWELKYIFSQSVCLLCTICTRITYLFTPVKKSSVLTLSCSIALTIDSYIKIPILCMFIESTESD